MDQSPLPTSPPLPNLPELKIDTGLKAKVKKFVSDFKTLPVKSKRLLSLGVVMMLVVALPILILAGVETRTFLLNRAASGEVTGEPTPTTTPSSTPQCKHEHAECAINNSGKECCKDLVCVTSDNPSGNGHCEKIEFTPTPHPCAMVNQTVSLTPQSQSGLAGTPLLYNIAVINNNGANCPKTEFTLSALAPSGWVVGLSNTILALDSGATGTAQVQFASSTSATPQGYPVGISVKGPRSIISASSAYIVLPVSPTPTPIACNQSCNYTINPPKKCQAGLTCWTASNLLGAPGVCRNPDCVTQANCVCTTPKPTVPPTPKPTAIPVPTGNPVISTTFLPLGRLRVLYSAQITGYDTNPVAKLTMTFTILPKGLYDDGCSGTPVSSSSTRPTITCTIRGTPGSWGLTTIIAVLRDNLGKSVDKTLYLWVNPF